MKQPRRFLRVFNLEDFHYVVHLGVVLEIRGLCVLREEAPVSFAAASAPPSKRTLSCCSPLASVAPFAFNKTPEVVAPSLFEEEKDRRSIFGTFFKDFLSDEFSEAALCARVDDPVSVVDERERKKEMID